jgi:hypothetical protein
MFRVAVAVVRGRVLLCSASTVYTAILFIVQPALQAASTV